MIFYIGAFLFSVVAGFCGLGPFAFFLFLFLASLNHTIKKYDREYQRWAKREDATQRALAEEFRFLQRDAAARAHIQRVSGSIDVPFRVIK